MSKKNPGTRQLSTGSDQDSLTAEESAALGEMEKDNGEGLPEEDLNLAEGASKPVAKKPAAKAESEEESEGAEEGAGEGGKGQEGVKGKPLPPEALAAVRIEREEKKTLREALKTAEDARKASDERFSTLEKRTNLILEKLVPKEEAAKPEVIPDFETDPAGWIAGTMKATGKSIQEIQTELAAGRQEKAQQTEQQKQQEVVRGVISMAAASEREFLAANPDYNDAGAFLQTVRVSQLEAIGYNAEEVQAIIQQEKFAIASKAQAAGKNPAEIVYNIAKTMGYAKKAKPAEGQGDGGGNGGGNGQGNGHDAAAAAAAKEKLRAASEGREQSASLSDARGQGPSPLTAKRLLEMSEAEFAAAMETDEGKALMGR